MSLETPHFLTSIDEDQVFVTAEQHSLEPAVLFEMLGSTTLHFYNINNPKEENMYLFRLREKADDTRRIQTEMEADETIMRMNHLAANFEEMYEKIRNISDRQLQNFVDYAQLRLAGDSSYFV